MQDKTKISYYSLKQRMVAFVEFRILHHKIHWKRCAGKRLLNGRECNNYIFDAILSGKPFMAARYGSQEMDAVLKTEITKSKGLQPELFYSDILCSISTNAGMFSNDMEGFLKFGEYYARCAADADLLGIWQMNLEEYLIKKYSSKAKLTLLRNLEPYYETEFPWSRALKGKKVLVVHPFANTIQTQYAKRQEIWNEDILPEFELITFKAIQTQCDEEDNRFRTWFDALKYMEKEIEKIEFDVAIIGCGAYGLPLASAVKRMGRQAIHLGGATQMLFGIIGRRWENIQFFKDKMNENWVRPSLEERPIKANQVEEGCYW